MPLKDYYKILNVKSDATSLAIKQSYRKLAMKYHPDKNPNDVLSAAVFSEIAEAYNVLSNSSARKDYNIQRYHTAPQEYVKPAESIEALLVKAECLKNQLLHVDPFRFNKDALLYSLKQILPADVSDLLKTDATEQKMFLEAIASCSKMLTSSQLKNLSKTLQPLYEKHKWLREELQTLSNEQIKKEQWEKYKIVIAVVITILLCIVIFFATKH